MEQQFILRLPETLKNVNPKDCKLQKITQREVNFIVNDKTYPGIICKLPTIVETQKVVENRLYKISDVSTLIIIYLESGFNIEEEILKYESSGLTAPMYYAKERRFAKSVVRTEDVERIEKKVAELLKSDLKSQKVEIIMNDKESNETDIDMLAAEIENELIDNSNKVVLENDIENILENINERSEINEKTVEIEKPKVLEKKPEILELEKKIKEKEEQLEKASNPILKKRFEQALETLKEEYRKMLNE